MIIIKITKAMEIITKTTTQPVMVAIFSLLFPTLSISQELSPGLMTHIWKVQRGKKKWKSCCTGRNHVSMSALKCHLVREWQGVNVPLLQSYHPLSVEAVPAKPQIYTAFYLQVILWRMCGLWPHLSHSFILIYIKKV